MLQPKTHKYISEFRVSCLNTYGWFYQDHQVTSQYLMLVSVGVAAEHANCFYEGRFKEKSFSLGRISAVLVNFSD